MTRPVVIPFVLLLLAALSLGIGSQETAAQDAGRPERFLVFTNGNPSVSSAVAAEARARGGGTLNEIRVESGLHLMMVTVPGTASGELARIQGVREVAPDIAPTQDTHNPNISEAADWGVTRIQANLPQATGITGGGVVVAVVDGGVQLDHPDLDANTAGLPHANCSGDSECTQGGATTPGSAGYDNDADGHGTGVAGIIAAEAGNGLGTAGVSPNAQIVAINCFEPSTFFSCLRGVRYAAGLDGNGQVVSAPRAQVVNMSWGWDKKLEKQCRSCVTTINTVMEEAWSQGLVLAASAGNSGACGGKGDNVGFPARLDKPIAVAATQNNANNSRACFSSTGPSLQADGLAAPGSSIESPWTNGYATWSGTSAAAPHVSGVAALILSENSALSSIQIKERLLTSAQDLGSAGPDNAYGFGLVRADRAVCATSSLC